MQLEYAKDPVWANAGHTMIDLTIKWDAINEELPFSASPNDTEAHGRAIFEATAAGQYGVIAEYVAPPGPTPEQIEAQIKANRRAAYIKESDPIFFMAQRGEATTEQWEAKIDEIKTRYPYYYDDQGNLIEAQ
jgi:hypothetical protein